MRKNFRRGAFALAAALTTASPLALMPVPAAAYVFTQVTIEGSQRIEPATILSYANIARGQDVSAGQLNDAQQRLQNAGLFDSVELIPQGNTLVIKVVEYPTINIINFEGNRRLKDDRLAEMIQSQSRHVYSPAKAEADARAIAQAYAVDGRLAARVTPRIIRRDGNRVDLVFEIQEGSVTEIERIGFTGNRAFSDRRLRQVLQTKQAGLLRAFISADTFSPDRLPLDEKLLTDFYRSRGYADFRVQAVAPEVARERDAFYVTFNIYEGPRYTFGRVDVVSEVTGLDVEAFRAQNRVRPGQVYNPQIVDASIGRMEGLATAQGLDFIAVEPRITRNPASGTLDLVLALVRGPRVFVERIDIEGNTTTLDQVIRRQFRTVEGDPFNPREIRNAAERIRALGYFADATVESRQGSSEQQVIVDVNVEEQPTGTLSFGASYGVSAGIGVNIGLTEENFLGRGQTIGLSVVTAKSSRSASFDFVEPAFLGRDLGARLSIWKRRTTQDNVKFNTDTAGLLTAIDFPTSPNGRISLRYRLTRSAMTDVTEIGPDPSCGEQDPPIPDDDCPTIGSSPILVKEAGMGKLVSSAIGYEYSYDSRRERIDPRTAWKFRFGQDFAGVGGDVHSITTSLYAGVESRAWREEVRLLAELEAGAIHMRDGEISRYIDRYNGSYVRGFETSGYGPRDLEAPNRDALGGNYYWVARAEAQFPLGLPEEYGILGGLFADVGSVWGLDNKVGAEGVEVDDGMKIRASVGASLFWDTPIGPLRFNFTKALRKEPYDETQPFDMTISTRF